MKYVITFIFLGCIFFGFIKPAIMALGGSPLPTAWTDGNCQKLKPEIKPSHSLSTEEVDAFWEKGAKTPHKITPSPYGSVKNFFSIINGERVKVDIVQYYSKTHKVNRQEIYFNGEEKLEVPLKIVNQLYSGPISISNKILLKYSSSIKNSENKHFYVVFDDGGTVYDTKVKTNKIY